MELEGTIAGRFDIQCMAGSGGMGSVYRAYDKEQACLVALKVLHGEASGELNRFSREARVLADLDHPGIVKFVSHGQLPGGKPYLVMEWLEGESLSQRLERELLTIGEALEMAHGVAEALGAAHGCGVVHRDLKPGNIFLQGGKVSEARLLDFGIASARGQQVDLTDTRTILGTPGYMAPEQIRASKHASPSADVFSLGCVIYKSLSGHIPFEGRNTLDLVVSIMTLPPRPIRLIRRDVSLPVEQFLTRVIDKDPAKRPQDGKALAREIREVQVRRAADQSPSERPEAPTDGDDDLPTVPTRVVELPAK